MSPGLPVYGAPCLRGQCRHYYTHPPRIVSLLMLAITYIQAMALHVHTQGRFNNHTVVQDPGHGTSVMGVMKMGNIVPRVEITVVHALLLKDVPL